MNFIDHAISEITNGEDFVQAITDIYGLDLKSYADAVKVFDEIGLIEEAEVLRGCDNDIRRECREML